MPQAVDGFVHLSCHTLSLFLTSIWAWKVQAASTQVQTYLMAVPINQYHISSQTLRRIAFPSHFYHAFRSSVITSQPLWSSFRHYVQHSHTLPSFEELCVLQHRCIPYFTALLRRTLATTIPTYYKH